MGFKKTNKASPSTKTSPQTSRQQSTNKSPPKTSPKPSQDGRQRRGKKIILYGPPGVGKTSFAANAPNAVFLLDSQEQGIHSLLDYGQSPEPKLILTADDWKETLSYLETINDTSPEWLILDSLTGFERYCFEQCCIDQYDNDWSTKGFFSYQQGPSTAAKHYWPELINTLQAIANSGINIILIAHSQIKTYDNPEGPNYDTYTTYLHKESWAQLNRWSEAVLFLNYYTPYEKGKGEKVKTINEDIRYLYCKRSPAFTAKNLYGLPEFLETGDSAEIAWNNFITAVNANAR
jgi:hypothetical protein